MQKIQHKILRELLKDGRASVANIAKKTRLSRDIVEYQIKKFQREGIIQGFNTIIYENNLGYKLVQLFLRVELRTRKDEADVAKILSNWPLSIWVVRCAGSYNFAVELYIKNTSDYEIQIEELIKKIPQNVAKHSARLVSYQYKFMQAAGEIIKDLKEVGETTEESYEHVANRLTETEQKILTHLEQDGRMKFTQLGKKVGLDADTVTYHYRKLKKQGVLLGIKPLIDMQKLGYTQYIVLIKLKQCNMSTNPLKGHLQQLSSVRYAVRHFGAMDIYCLWFSKSTEEFYKELEKLELSNREIIEKIEIMPVFRKYKESLFPKGLQV